MSDDGPDEPEPSSGMEDAQRALLIIAGVVALPVVAVALAWKGVVPALVVAFLAVCVWAQVADVIPTERELKSFGRSRTPAETGFLALMVLAAAGLLVLMVV